jgi:hypothetical protein
VASSARETRLKGNTVARLEVLDGRADFNNGSGRLMAENHGLLDDKVTNGTVDPVVDVGTANTGVVHGDEDIVLGLEGGLRDLGVADIVGLVEEEGEVLRVTLAGECLWSSGEGIAHAQLVLVVGLGRHFASVGQ